MTDARVAIGPAAWGGFLSVAPEPDRVRAGPPFTPLAASALACVEAELGVAIGGLVVPPGFG